jgi:hypothetical protein
MIHQSHTQTPNTNWELFAELELPLSGNQNETIHEWLDRILKPLKLYDDICHRVEISLYEGATRTVNAQSEKKHQQIHVKIYLPTQRQLKGNNWSFFRVEKIEDQVQDGQVPDHAIELYLYLEAH